MNTKYIWNYIGMIVLSLVALSCSRTKEVEKKDILSWFTSFSESAQEVIAQGQYVVKTVAGMPSESTLVGVSPYDNAIEENMVNFIFGNTVEEFSSGRMSSEAQVAEFLQGHNYSIEELRSQFRVEINNWSNFEIWHVHFQASYGRHLKGLLLVSLENNIAVYMLFINTGSDM